jgi:hypothetical protein
MRITAPVVLAVVAVGFPAASASRPSLDAVSALYTKAASSAFELVSPTATDSSIRLWADVAPGDIPGEIGDEFVTCLTPKTPVVDCKGTSFGFART